MISTDPPVGYVITGHPHARASIFTDDPSKIITTDISTGGLYASIISNISRNNNTLKGLCEALVTDSSKMSKYINELISNDVLRKKKNFNSQRNITYEICDPMLAFYYRFIRENSELIKNGYGELSDILPPPTLTFRGGGFSVKNTIVFRLPELMGFPVPQGTLLVFT